MNIINKIKFKLIRIVKVWKRYRIIYSHYSHLGKDVLSAMLKNDGWAACPSLLEQLAHIMSDLKPKLIVEIGSGVTTMLIAKTKSEESVLFSLDQSKKEIEKTSQIIKKTSGIIFVYPKQEGVIDYSFYKKLNGRVDLIIIDGPTGDRFGSEAREAFDSIISDKTICIIDDTDRTENDIYAHKLATARNLIKKDFTDPIYKNQRFSILFPVNIEENLTF